MKYSIEAWAKKFISKYHPQNKLNFEKDVERIEFFNCFTLKVFNDKGIVTDYYFVLPEDSKLSEESQPFQSRFSRYFTNALDGAVPKLWIGYIVIDDEGMPIDAQRFPVNLMKVE